MFTAKNKRKNHVSRFIYRGFEKVIVTLNGKSGSAQVRYGSHTNAAVPETYLYDGNGALTNLISGSNTAFSAACDALGRLSSLQGGAGVPPAAFGYDALGNRLIVGDRLWIPDPADPLIRVASHLPLAVSR